MPPTGYKVLLSVKKRLLKNSLKFVLSTRHFNLKRRASNHISNYLAEQVPCQEYNMLLLFFPYRVPETLLLIADHYKRELR